MAIRRCPYCKAIIDESQKYCNNCGTQLLFPEDEGVEEAIKGEKIVDEDFKDADDDENLAEPSESSGEEDARSEVIDLEEVLEGGSGFPDELVPGKKFADVDDDDLGEDPDEVEEDEPLPVPKRGRPRKAIPAIPPPPPAVPTRAPTRRPTSNLGSPPPAVKPATAPRPPAPPVSVPPAAPASGRLDKQGGRDFVLDAFSGEPAATPEPPSRIETDAEADEPKTAKRRDEESDTKEEIARLISALEKKHQKAELPDAGDEIIAPPDISNDLPTWSDLARDTETPEAAEDDVQEKPVAGSFVPGDTMDFQDEVMRRAGAAAPPKTTIGMPETPVKPRTAILFERDEEEPMAEAVPAVRAPSPVIRRKTEDFGREDAPVEEKGEISVRGGLGFFRRIAATLFDFVFVALFWAEAVGLAARLMDAAAFDLVRAATVPVGLLFGVLFAGYLFLFFFFLGETLGGRLMSRRDAA
jgi:hypothetical protein